MKFLLEDSEHGAANRDVLADWLADWLPLAEDAAQALRPVFADLPAGIEFEAARTNARIDFDEMCEQCGVADLTAAAGGAK